MPVWACGPPDTRYPFAPDALTFLNSQLTTKKRLQGPHLYKCIKWSIVLNFHKIYSLFVRLSPHIFAILSYKNDTSNQAESTTFRLRIISFFLFQTMWVAGVRMLWLSAACGLPGMMYYVSRPYFPCDLSLQVQQLLIAHHKNPHLHRWLSSSECVVLYSDSIYRIHISNAST